MQASLNDNMALKERLKLAECDMEHFEREKQVRLRISALLTWSCVDITSINA